MKQIGIVGSGRWAKVTLKILSKILSEEIRFIVFSNHGIKQIQRWIIEENLKKNYFEVVQYNQISKKLCDAYIIVNAPKDHFEISKNIIALKKPLIIEKPISLSKKDVKNLIELAKKENVILATSNIFLFPDYILNFKKIVSTYKNISSIEFIWSDPKSEFRYVDLKKYDPSIAIHKDVLPHILSIVFYLFESNDVSFKNICFLRGGSYLEIYLSIKGINFNVQIQRNSKKRKRIIKILDKDLLKMDFSNEPGIIEINSNEKIFDSKWDKSESPATKMYRSFFNTLKKRNSILDPRIKPSEKIYSLIDDIDNFYVKEQEKYIRNMILNQSIILDDFIYCIKEFFLVQSEASYSDIDNKVHEFIKLIKNKNINIQNLLNKELLAFIKNTLNS